ncbi:hypothetical protein GDO86_007498 [Hymenochirus boettgeri]|uniref:Uncharacterized protein n=1 Tax=Hymenochirus boettgeri TaxID=247094 RepID=A0A8T2ITX4_9PIPI|nr:hypothetical protein GDO86_007498 [Hymenochirus boettgeri]
MSIGDLRLELIQKKLQKFRRDTKDYEMKCFYDWPRERRERRQTRKHDRIPMVTIGKPRGRDRERNTSDAEDSGSMSTSSRGSQSDFLSHGPATHRYTK